MKRATFMFGIFTAIMLMLIGCSLKKITNDGNGENNHQDGNGEDSSVNIEDESPSPWLTALEEQGIEIDKLAFEELCNDISNNNGINTALISQDGNIILEQYKNGYDENSLVPFNSCAKSIMSILIGIAIDQGLIESVDTKISIYFPEIDNDIDGRKKEITIKHLLEFTVGLDWPEWGAWNYWPSEFVSSKDWVKFVLNRPIIEEPGEEFAYNTGASQLLSAILQQVSGDDALTFAKKYLFDLLDIRDVEWGEDPQGFTTGGFQLKMRPVDAMKIGQLYLNKGKIDDIQIVSEEWVDESTKLHSEGGYYGSRYGYNWWVEDGNGIDYYYAMGYGGQYIFVAPKQNVIAVFTSDLSMQQMNQPKLYFEVLLADILQF